MKRMSKELEDAFLGISDPDVRKQLEAQWQEYADQNKYYEESFYPQQAADMAELDVKLQDGKTLETPEEQMGRFNQEMMDKIDEIKGHKEKGIEKEPDVDQDKSGDNETPQQELTQKYTENREDVFRLTFDNRDQEPQEAVNEPAPQMSKADKVPLAEDKMHWGVTWERMPEPLQKAISSVKDDFLREELRTEWKELSEQNRHYERSAYPKQVESVVDYNRTFKANITIETPPDQMRRFNGIIMDKIAEINGEKEKGREQTYELEQPEDGKSTVVREETDFKLTFDNREDFEDNRTELDLADKDTIEPDKELNVTWIKEYFDKEEAPIRQSEHHKDDIAKSEDKEMQQEMDIDDLEYEDDY